MRESQEGESHWSQEDALWDTYKERLADEEKSKELKVQDTHSDFERLESGELEDEQRLNL